MSTKRLLIHTLIFSVSFLIATAFYLHQRNVEAQKVSLFIQTSFKDTVKSGNIYQNAKDLHAIETLGLAKCIKLYDSDPSRPFYVSSDPSNCYFFYNLKFEASNGLVWNLKYSLPFSAEGVALYGFGFFGMALMVSATFEIIRKRSKKLESEALSKLAENEMLKNLTQQARHDVASPLSAIKVAASLPGMDEKIRKLLDMAIARTEEIVESMRLESEGSNIDKVSLNEVIEGVLTEKRAEHPKVKVQFEPPNVDIKALANKSNFKRLLSNLINNSVDAGATEIRIEIDRTNGALVALKVEDDGSGLPPEMFAKVFQKGFSFKKGHGTGLGLFHAKTHVELWGGKIAARRACSLKGLLIELSLRTA